jgi:hypothetical protein
MQILAIFIFLDRNSNFSKRHFWGLHKKQFFEFFNEEITLDYFKNNIFRNNLIRAIDWRRNCDV